MKDGKSRRFRLEVSSRRSAFLLAAFLGFILHGAAHVAQRTWMLYLPVSDTWPSWACLASSVVSEVLPAAVAWGVVGFGVSLIFRSRAFPDCFFAALMVEGAVVLIVMAEFVIKDLPLARNPGAALLFNVGLLAFPAAACACALAGGKVGTRLRGGAARIRESAEGV